MTPTMSVMSARGMLSSRMFATRVLDTLREPGPGRFGGSDIHHRRHDIEADHARAQPRGGKRHFARPASEIQNRLARHTVIAKRLLDERRAKDEGLAPEETVDEVMQRVGAAALECLVIVVREASEVTLRHARFRGGSVGFAHGLAVYAGRVAWYG